MTLFIFSLHSKNDVKYGTAKISVGLSHLPDHRKYICYFFFMNKYVLGRTSVESFKQRSKMAEVHPSPPTFIFQPFSFILFLRAWFMQRQCGQIGLCLQWIIQNKAAETHLSQQKMTPYRSEENAYGSQPISPNGRQFRTNLLQQMMIVTQTAAGCQTVQQTTISESSQTHKVLA